MPLTKYRTKRDFKVTSEPKGDAGKDTPLARKQALKDSLIFVVQKHQASHLHYDFRLEWGGVLLSWAIPKGPSLDPSVKRLAMAVEDHPLEYAKFEGIIPEGQYGGGTVMVWDQGTWEPETDIESGLRNGELKFSLDGKKLRGSWALIRTKGGPAKTERASWLLIKHRDRYASASDVVTDKPRSVVSRRLMAGIATAAGGNVEKAAESDPQR
jgi:bifunctional non-homologous end joining protein LigD